MIADKVRTDYEGLKQIAQVFTQQAEATQQTLAQMKQDMGVLQQGDWIGTSADRLYAEMTMTVLPSVTRLQQALENASRVTSQISQVMKQAEDASARVLRGEGSSGAADGAGGSEGISVGQPVGPSGGSLGSPDGVSTPQPAGPSTGNPGERPANTSSGPVTTSTGGGDTAADRMLRTFDPKVAETAEKSPTLMAQLKKLEAEGWTIVKGTPGQSSETVRGKKQIIINPSTPADWVAGVVAHEVGHALNPTPYHAPTDTMTREQFVQLNVEAQLKGEATAQFNRYLVRDEILAAGGPEIPCPGAHDYFLKAYDAYKSGRATRDRVITAMTGLMGLEAMDGSGENYREYFTRTFEAHWDKQMTPEGGRP